MILLIAKLPSSSVTFVPLYPLKQGNTPYQFFHCKLITSLLFFGNVPVIPFIWNKIPFKILSLIDRNAFHRAVKLFLVLYDLFCVKVSAHYALYFCMRYCSLYM